MFRNRVDVEREISVEDALDCNDVEWLINMLECGYIDDLDVTEAMDRLSWTYGQQVSLIRMMEGLEQCSGE